MIGRCYHREGDENNNWRICAKVESAAYGTTWIAEGQRGNFKPIQLDEESLTGWLPMDQEDWVGQFTPEADMIEGSSQWFVQPVFERASSGGGPPGGDGVFFEAEADAEQAATDRHGGNGAVIERLGLFINGEVFLVKQGQPIKLETEDSERVKRVEAILSGMDEAELKVVEEYLKTNRL